MRLDSQLEDKPSAPVAAIINELVSKLEDQLGCNTLHQIHKIQVASTVDENYGCQIDLTGIGNVQSWPSRSQLRRDFFKVYCPNHRQDDQLKKTTEEDELLREDM